MAWHLHGLSWSAFLDLPYRERRAIELALDDRIEEHNEAAKAPPKDKEP